ncbi:hypothetical protein K7H91_21595 [Martelella mediterranea]|uniref:hypothetical protein n=1 Tax=Martelella mediterranea TaxID=293089 RepID=UPI001E5E2B4E|nr:hypothetical protein [Martelella mediterranea]MCD1636360.1 hypothetical protein [Martelella mediterranea]
MHPALSEWQRPEDLKKLIPPVRPVCAKGSIDRYGFTYLLADICGLKKPRRTFSEWLHGWAWDDQPTEETLAVGNLHRSVPVVVRNNLEYEALKAAGFKKVFIGGLPFCYLGNQHLVRNDHALLAIPPHSAESERLNDSQIEYFDYLEAIKSDFDGVYVSIFHLDWGGALHKSAEKRGLNVVLGARPDDANSLSRTRSLLDAFKFVTSNTMGSHFVYALYAGCRFSFSGPLYSYNEEVFLGNGNPNNHSLSRVERLMEVHSENYLRSRFDRFFLDHPRDGRFDIALGRSEIGHSNMLNRNRIIEAVGWTVYGQMHGYLCGAINRAQRLIASYRE